MACSDLRSLRGLVNWGFRQEVVGPIQNKVGQIFLAPPLRNVLGQIGTKINFRFMMDPTVYSWRI